MMSEPLPTYTTRTRRRHDDPDANADAIIEATRRQTTYRASTTRARPNAAYWRSWLRWNGCAGCWH